VCTLTETCQEARKVAMILADVAEELAVEIIGNFSAEDYEQLSKTINRLADAANYLVELKIDVPFVVMQCLKTAQGTAPSN
jgi:adenine deaminase